MYATRRHGGIRYTYVATWTVSAAGIAWDAVVRRDAHTTHGLSGELRATEERNVALLVAREVERCIEERAGVD